MSGMKFQDLKSHLTNYDESKLRKALATHKASGKAQWKDLIEEWLAEDPKGDEAANHAEISHRILEQSREDEDLQMRLKNHINAACEVLGTVKTGRDQ